MAKYSIVNNESGEVVGDYKPKRKRRNIHYYLVFWENFGKMKITMPYRLTYVIGLMDRQNRLQLTSYRVKKICDNLKISRQVLYNVLSKAVKSNLMMRISGGEYMINPFLFSKSNIGALEDLRAFYSQKLALSTNKIKKTAQKQDIPVNIIQLKQNKG